MATTADNIRRFILLQQWDDLHAFLRRLSNSEFRRVEYDVREHILPTLPNDAFWAALLHLVRYRAQAFSSGMLAIRHLADDGTLRFDTPEALQLAQTITPELARKLVDMAVPLMQTPQQIDELFRLFPLDDDQQRVAVLIRTTSPLTYFTLFRTLCHAHDNRTLALQCCRYIARKGDDLSLNMASILREYFGLHEWQGQCALHIEPYELNFLDQSYERFRYALEGKRPTILDNNQTKIHTTT